MPLVKIDVQAGWQPHELRLIADTVDGVMRDTFQAPEGDRYQVLTEHAEGQIIVGDAGLAYPRTNKVIIIEILQQGRSEHQKRQAYREIADRLEMACGIPSSDVIVAVNNNTKADWSFGLGRAPFIDGDL